ncbi:hypothetical protein L486_06599 [Kwoniella mangroviensis CBS 10435]|uniref:NAD-dependent epimerase/dehydratase domain-containing protein n=1 Tax=Kwoniella mangroviensis CBS 10435 TaxID=1331196 RepID=A0A1B9IKE5_9TREE|nr:hypothetical protein L486_06599 [Kwoniella mangroviensis CBS 10435]
MRILLTGSSGVVGTYVLTYLLEQGHTIFAVDRIPLSQSTLDTLSAQYPKLNDILDVHTVDLTSIEQVKKLFSQYSNGTIEGLIHLAAIPHPESHDPRFVHNTNTTISYNVLYTAAEHGTQRLVQASSVNYTGLAYTTKGRQRFERLPITEEEPSHAEDPYALSKQICEIQADSLCHLFPTISIASLRFHHILPTLSEAEGWSRQEEFWTWTSSLSASQACLLGLTTPQEGKWKGHEAFNIVASDIAWTDPVVSSSDLLEKSEWSEDGRIGQVDKTWWVGDDRRRKGFWDCTKAERLLGWVHTP